MQTHRPIHPAIQSNSIAGIPKSALFGLSGFETGSLFLPVRGPPPPTGQPQPPIRVSCGLSRPAARAATAPTSAYAAPASPRFSPRQGEPDSGLESPRGFHARSRTAGKKAGSTPPHTIPPHSIPKPHQPALLGLPLQREPPLRKMAQNEIALLRAFRPRHHLRRNIERIQPDKQLSRAHPDPARAPPDQTAGSSQPAASVPASRCVLLFLMGFHLLKRFSRGCPARGNGSCDFPRTRRPPQGGNHNEPRFPWPPQVENRGGEP